MAYYKIYLDELSDASNKLVNYSNTDINNKIGELKNLAESIKWTGSAHDSFINGFNKQIYEVTKLNDKIRLFGEYLGFAHESYDNTNNDVNKSWNNFLDELKVIK